MKLHIIWLIALALLLIPVYFAGLKMGQLSSPAPEVENTETPTAEQVVEDDIEQKPQMPFVPAGWRRLDDYTIVVDVAVLPGELRAIWMEYGLEADALTAKTAPTSDELGMGTPGEYGSYSITVAHSELTPGLSYFYRIVAETERGDVLYTGLNRFTAGK
jgi:hypothetical protein